MYFAKAGHEEIGLYLRYADYRFLEGTSKISPCIILIPSSLACYVHVFRTILVTENHISLDIKILRRSYKIIHGENLDISLGNHLNPKQSSKFTIFMTGFFAKGLFSIPGEMLNFKSCLARKAKESLRSKEHILNVCKLLETPFVKQFM